MLLCDGGGSNSASRYVFKEALQNLAQRIGFEIRVAHLPARGVRPARVPIFLRIAHYSAELALRNQTLPLPLIRYLGHDRDSEHLFGKTSEDRNLLFQALVEAQRAIVILDGLDELPETNRGMVVNAIEAFVKELTAVAADTACRDAT